MDEQNEQKTSTCFICKKCNYFTSRKNNYDRHILTDKHKRVKMDEQNEQNEQDGKLIKKQKNNIFNCYCGNSYKWKQGLIKHQKNCTELYTNKTEDTDIKMLTNLVLEVIKQNNEAQKQNQELTNKLVEICKVNTINNTHINNNSNNTNNNFNLNVFLNETCKDAMNITDFIDSIQLQLSDLIHVGEVGYVEGISSIINTKLKELDITKRPVHCTDKKRETIYIKDEGQWTKEDDNKSKLRKSIKKITDKNIKLLTLFREKYPDCREAESSLSNKYCKMVIEAMGGMGSTTSEKEDKIIKNITKVTTIEKICNNNTK
jgi:hypothetical protein